MKTPTISPFSIWAYKIAVVTLLGASIYFALNWQITSYEVSKNQEISNLKLQQLQDQLYEKSK